MNQSDTITMPSLPLEHAQATQDPHRQILREQTTLPTQPTSFAAGDPNRHHRSHPSLHQHQHQHQRSTYHSANAPSSTRDRLRSSREMLRIGTETSDVDYAATVLYKACEVLENWADDFEEQQAQRMSSVDDDDDDMGISGGNHRRSTSQQRRPTAPHGRQQEQPENPFCILLAQAKHRLAQVCLLRGNLEVACRLFLQVLLHDPDTLSPAALAMAWYDVGLIYITYGRIEHARAALEQSIVLLYSRAANNERGHVDETMQFFIQQAIKQTESMQRTGVAPFLGPVAPTSLPWSVQFTMTTYSYDDPTPDGDSMMLSPQDLIWEETQRLLDPSLHHAGAA